MTPGMTSSGRRRKRFSLSNKKTIRSACFTDITSSIHSKIDHEARLGGLSKPHIFKVIMGLMALQNRYFINGVLLRRSREMLSMDRKRSVTRKKTISGPLERIIKESLSIKSLVHSPLPTVPMRTEALAHLLSSNCNQSIFSNRLLKTSPMSRPKINLSTGYFNRLKNSHSVGKARFSRIEAYRLVWSYTLYFNHA